MYVCILDDSHGPVDRGITDWGMKRFPLLYVLDVFSFKKKISESHSCVFDLIEKEKRVTISIISTECS